MAPSDNQQDLVTNRGLSAKKQVAEASQTSQASESTEPNQAPQRSAARQAADSERRFLLTQPVSSLLQRFAVPSIIALLISSLYNFVDQVFIGSYVGQLGNAATNVSFPFTTICLSLALLIGIGTAARYSLFLGAGKRREARSLIGNSFFLLILAAVIFFVVNISFLDYFLGLFAVTPEIYPYAHDYSLICAFGFPVLLIQIAICAIIRADGSPRYSMIVITIGAVVNIVLDPIFIKLLGLGIRGAAYATIIGQFISFFASIAYLPRMQFIKLRWRDLHLSWRESIDTAAMGLSNFMNQFIITLVIVILNNSLRYYGSQTIYGANIPLSACGIVMKINSILIAFMVGISQGAQAIIGYNYGARAFDRVKKTYWLAIRAAFVISLILYIFIEILPHWPISLFGKDEEMYFNFSIQFMRIFLFGAPLIGNQIISSNFFASIGKPFKGLMLSMTRQLIFLIPLLLLLPRIWGLYGLLYAAPISDIASFLVTEFFVLREMRHIDQLAAA
ncbi:MAG: MATE family efflux transporter [Eubacteriales bacterium]|nr:MATE family efflux transporter [Eubacteriales bacterium]